MLPANAIQHRVPRNQAGATPLAPMARNAKNREKDRQPKPSQEPPLAGPHAKPELTDKDKTAGTGMLLEPDEKDVEGPTG
jgi:hypothetical protein